MNTTIERGALSSAAAICLLCVSAVADAGGPVRLTDGQLDGITAGQGGPYAGAAAAATATGLFTTGNTLTNATTEVGNSPFEGSAAMATAVGAGVAMNGVTPGASSAAATTYTEAPGNVVANVSWNQTIYGIGSTIQVSFSSTVGDVVPGVP